MSPNQDESRHILFRALSVYFKKHLSGPKAAQALRLAEQFYRRVPLEDLAQQDDAVLARIVESLLHFMRQRVAGKFKLRVYNPNLKENGWESTHTILEVVNEDMPFLVDSLRLAVGDLDITSHLVIHPLVRVERDAGGHMMALPEPDSNKGQAESVLHPEIDKQTDLEKVEQIKARVLATLHDVQAAVTDWRAMKEKAGCVAEELRKCKSPYPKASVDEAVKFVEWIGSDHFTFLGYREYSVESNNGNQVLVARTSTGLGILGKGQKTSRPVSVRDSGDFLDIYSEPLIITKTNARNTVHRPGHMDYVGVLIFDKKGAVVGEHRFLGLYTSGAYNRRPWEIPYVRRTVSQVMEYGGFNKGGHGSKALMHVLETLPRDELFQSSAEELYALSTGVLNLQERQRTRLFIRRDRFGRFFSCLVYIPRDRFNTATRTQIQAVLLIALDGEKVDFEVMLGESVLARLHLIIRVTAGAREGLDVKAIERQITEVVRSWHDDIKDILISKLGQVDGLQLAEEFGAVMPLGYTEEVSPWVAAFDVQNMAALKSHDDMRMSLYQPRRQRAGLVRFKIFKFDNPIPLSDVLPMLENMGLRVVSERPYEVVLNSGAAIWVQDFDILPANGISLDLERIQDNFQSAFARVVSGDMESDGFNRLIVAANMNWRQVTILRAYCRYLRQTDMPFSQAYMESALEAHPGIARLIVEMFEAQFDPRRSGENKATREAQSESLRNILEGLAEPAKDTALSSDFADVALARTKSNGAFLDSCRVAIRNALERVRNLDEDRILRSFADAVGASLRTNFYQKNSVGEHKEYISVKLDSEKVPYLPRPRPMYEIFVYSPRVEGVHLRGGKVARGGLRWSDRHEDFRTEILGLMKAQNVKNTMIVPVGAKGGFVVKRPVVDGDHAEKMAEVIYCYRCFISGLLDITDNLQGDSLVYPEDVVRLDGDDPYLVVAADKGTASFSDIANAVSEDYGFWMGDAFASGGSVGYDHKVMGITAKGGWESVKRHFLELGRDCQEEDIAVVGIGDMGGDVFGNGMLLSKHIKLQAAFNHVHIFLDPEPDAAISWKERRRLFAANKPGWEQYNKKLISKGGGIYLRSEKTIKLSAQVKSWLGIELDNLTPQELIRELLKAPVDLLWNGGIGTYVKAASETDLDVGDRSNDVLRVNGAELRCKVVGEGGNLGLTQLGRIEFALAGGKINTDFIDNSAGVDCSDNEVNIKILLSEALVEGRLDQPQRNALLESMTEEVSRLVLRDNYLQVKALSMMEAMSSDRLGSKIHFIARMEQAGVLDRQLEFLPGSEELIDREKAGKGLTRPELAVLLSYSKITLYQSLLDSDVPEDPHLSRELEDYFPTPLRESFKDLMPRHRLKREIIATKVTNSLVNRMGATFVLRMQEDTGATAAAIARAYYAAREILQAREVWAELEKMDGKLAESVQIKIVLKLWNLVRHATRWLLNHRGHDLDIAVEIDRFRDGVRSLRNSLGKVTDPAERADFKARQKEYADAGTSIKFAKHVASFGLLYSSLDIVEVCAGCSSDVDRVARVYYGLSERMCFEWLRRQVEALPVDGQWHANARAALRDELYSHHSALTRLVLDCEEDVHWSRLIDNWMKANATDVEYCLNMLTDMRANYVADYAMVSVAIRGIEHLIRLAR